MKNKLVLGQRAPHFKATDVLGNSVDLSEYAKQYTLLVFLRYAGCPWCNLALHRLALEQKLLLESNCRVIAFVQSSRESIERNVYARHAVRPPFPIIADPDKTIYEQYGVTSSVKAAARSIIKVPYWVHAVRHHGFGQSKLDGDLFLVPATFLVSDRSQEIIKINYASSFYDHETFTDIYQKLIFKEA